MRQKGKDALPLRRQETLFGATVALLLAAAGVKLERVLWWIGAVLIMLPMARMLLDLETPP